MRSAFLPETCFQHVQRMASMADWPMHARWKFVHDFVLAISGMHAQGLVHCDLKPDNVMVGPGPDFSVYLIDFGCVARPGDSVPMTCLFYKPPEDAVSLSWDVFSAGRILQELEEEGLVLCRCFHELCLEMCLHLPCDRPCAQQCFTRVLLCQALACEQCREQA